MSLPAADRAARESSRALRILVVDDDVHVARAMCRRLRGHDVHMASSGVDAVALCLQGDFDLILCDVMMPNLSGVGVHQRLSILRPEMVPRIVFVTGGIFTEEVVAFMDRVENRILEKPVDRQVLADVLAAAAAWR
jgi:two-component system, NtrC family, sensor kinase